MEASVHETSGINPIWLAQSRLRRRRFDECIEICTDVLEKNPYDQVGTLTAAARLTHSVTQLCMLQQAVWYLKCRALTLKNWIDDTDLEEEVGDAHVCLIDKQGTPSSCVCREWQTSFWTTTQSLKLPGLEPPCKGQARGQPPRYAAGAGT
jgi:hypothetical protein